MNSFGIGTIG
jgi:hypothetical protein